MKCTFELNSKGFIKQRESFDLEFKEAFHYGDSLAEYIRSIVGMANNKGGEIIFGIKDRPREPKGLQNDKFETTLKGNANKKTKRILTEMARTIIYKRELCEKQLKLEMKPHTEHSN